MRETFGIRVRALVKAIRDGDPEDIEAAVLSVSRSHRWLAPLALTISTLVLLIDGLRLIFSNWRLTILQVLPAVWVWLAMFDLKVHVLHGRSFHEITGWRSWAAMGLIAVITIGAFYLNAVTAFAIMNPDGPSLPEGRRSARRNWRMVVTSGAVIGVLVGWSAVFAARHGRHWFTLFMGISVGLMMLAYVSVPTRLLNADTKRMTRRDKLVNAAVTGTLSGVAAAPAYVLSRVGILMLGSHALFIPGVIVTAVGFALEAGASSAVRAIKMSMKLLAGGALEPSDAEAAATRSSAAAEPTAAEPAATGTSEAPGG